VARKRQYVMANTYEADRFGQVQACQTIASVRAISANERAKNNLARQSKAADDWSKGRDGLLRRMQLVAAVSRCIFPCAFETVLTYSGFRP
jgi:hypothetical protein